MIPKKNKEKKELKLKIEKKDLVVDKANKYIRRGRFDDGNWFKPKSPKKEKKPLSYKDWFFMNSKAEPCTNNDEVELCKKED